MAAAGRRSKDTVTVFGPSVKVAEKKARSWVVTRISHWTRIGWDDLFDKCKKRKEPAFYGWKILGKSLHLLRTVSSLVCKMDFHPNSAKPLWVPSR